MKNKYYQLVATIDNETEIIYGSFIKSEADFEKDAEKETLKDQGYKKIKVICIETEEQPDKDVYKNQIVTKAELFIMQAPSFNFEYNPDQLLEMALERGYVLEVGPGLDKYIINSDYEGSE